MNNFEQQLNNLPKAKLSRRADLVIRYKLARTRFERFFSDDRINFIAPARFRPVMAVMTILVLVFSGTTSAYAYSSNEVTRASFLYPVKIGLEKLELSFASTPAEQLKVHNKLAGRRIAEAQFLSSNAKVIPMDLSASSSVDLASIKLEHEEEFNQTLDDADAEIDQANDNAEMITDEQERNQSLAILSDSHLNGLDKIKNMAQGIGLEVEDTTTDNIALVLENIKQHQQRVVRAASQFNGDLRKADENEESNFKAASSSEDYSQDLKKATTSPAEAENSLEKVKTEIKELESELSQGGRVSEKQIKRLSDRLNKKVNQAKSAIETGDLKKFNGLLRATEALTNNGLHFLKENKQDGKKIEPPPLPKSIDKVKGQYNAQEIQSKLEEQRKKLEEKRSEEQKRALEQARTSESEKIENSTTSTNPDIISTEKENSSAETSVSGDSNTATSDVADSEERD